MLAVLNNDVPQGTFAATHAPQMNLTQMGSKPPSIGAASQPCVTSIQAAAVPCFIMTMLHAWGVRPG